MTIVLVALSFLRISETISPTLATVLIGITAVLQGIASPLCTYLIFGTISWVVAQYLAVPLRPIKLRPALKVSRKKWKSFAFTGLLGTVLAIGGGIACAIVGFILPALIWLVAYLIAAASTDYLIIAGIICAVTGLIGLLGAHAFFSLVSPVVMMENRSGINALRRSVQLVRRSFLTASGAAFITFLLPAIIAGSIAFVVKASTKAFFPSPTDAAVARQQPDTTENPNSDRQTQSGGLNFSVGTNKNMNLDASDRDMGSRLKETAQDTAIQIFWLPMHILVTSFTAIMFALLYLKTRQAGGECTHEFLAKFEEAEPSKNKWQERVRNRLIQSGRVTSKP